jgi:hypothetical protein
MPERITGNLGTRPDNIYRLFAGTHRQSNCFLGGFGFALNLIEVEPMLQHSSVVCLISWRMDKSWRSPCQMVNGA